MDLIARLERHSEKGLTDCADVALVKWTPVDEGLPKSPYGCLLIVWDTEPMTGREFLNYLPYFAGWDGDQWNDADGEQIPFEVAYWMPLPKLPNMDGGET